jgi:hypothetical protein
MVLDGLDYVRVDVVDDDPVSFCCGMNPVGLV